MEINWFTVVAQLVNFFILVWLLKRYLYKPILKGIDDRENKIAAQLQEAEVKKAEAIQEQEDFLQKNRLFDQEKKDRMDEVAVATAEERQKLLNQARTDADALTTELYGAAKEQQQHQHLELNRKIKDEVFAVARKMLSELASAGLEEQLAQVFIRRLKALKEEELTQLKTAFEGNHIPIVVRSAFVFPKKQQQLLKKAVDEVLKADSSLQFEETPALIGGIELSTNEYKVDWNISAYLRALEETSSKKASTKTPHVVEKK
ncbi:MAG: F-type H+-transporting ATPase subunit b [Marivirga sp.]|jgi:F-type H+-transporting ATPase subunit b